MKYLVLILEAPPGQPGARGPSAQRRGALAVDVRTGQPVAIERYEAGDPKVAVQNMLRREGWTWDLVTIGPTVQVPGRQLYEFTDRLRGMGRHREKEVRRAEARSSSS